MELLGIELSTQEFDRLMCEQATGKELKVINGQVVAVEHKLTQNELAKLRIIELKQKLADSDYKVLKYLEGELSQEEYDEIVAKRKEWRREINELEKQNKESK